jgi:ABC-2 type transport system ATP-binding protein
MMLQIQEHKAATASVSSPIITVQQLSKQFGNFTAVHNISFEVAEGEIFGFLGPNGAGKSTTIKMLCTLLRPTSGQAFVAGYDVRTQSDAVRSSLGIVFQDNSLDSGLTAQENLDFHCMVYRVPRSERKSRIDWALDLMGITEHRHRIVKTFSGGMRRRLEIARGLLHRPRLLFLDEPTVGLDPQTRKLIWDYVRDLRQSHHTAIFMTTHYMDEAENCDRIAIIDHGEIIALNTPAALKRMIGTDQIELETNDNARMIQAIEALQVTDFQQHGQKITLQVHEAERFVPRLLGSLPDGVVVETLQVRGPTLEDVFIELTGRRIREDEGAKDEARLNMRQRGRI